MGVLHLIGFKYIFGRIFTALNKVLAVQTSIQGFLKKTNFWKYYLAKLFLQEIIFMSYTHGMIIGKGFWIKEKEYKSWRIYFIFRAPANSRQKSNQAKTKHSKVFVKPQFILIY